MPRLHALARPPRAFAAPAWIVWALGALPFAGICLSVALWDRIDPTVFGLPFNMFWLIAWMALTPLCLWGAYRSGGFGRSRPPDAGER